MVLLTAKSSIHINMLDKISKSFDVTGSKDIKSECKAYTTKQKCDQAVNTCCPGKNSAVDPTLSGKLPLHAENEKQR